MPSSLENIIPVPWSRQKSNSFLSVETLNTYNIISPDQNNLGLLLQTIFAKILLKIMSTSQPEDAVIQVMCSKKMAKEEFSLEINEENIVICGGSDTALRYAIGAFEQMLLISCQKGTKQAKLQCGKIHDKPRFAWRGFMIDSARHFQRVDTIMELLTQMAQYRLNVLHWHLTDSIGWRYESKLVPMLISKSENSGSYSQDDLRRIVTYAKELGISIVPELDIPGHSGNLVNCYREWGCQVAHVEHEYCIGNPQTKQFIYHLIRELMDIFPDSQYIHIGGDEASTLNWDRCHICKKAMKDKRLSTSRELEHDFMTDVCDFIIDCGRKPIVWGLHSNLRYRKEVTVQVWQNIHEPLFLAKSGNKAIYSVRNSLYFDYPANSSEAQESWMFALPEEGVYMTDPYVTWPNDVKNTILGVEACLWTELIPDWRFMQKIKPRLAAFSEVAWSMVENKNYRDFAARKEQLIASGLN